MKHRKRSGECSRSSLRTLSLQWDKKKLQTLAMELAVVPLLVTSLTGCGNVAAQEEYEEKMALAEQYFQQEKYEKAEDQYKQAMEIKPKESEPVIQLVEIYKYLEEPRKQQEMQIILTERFPKEAEKIAMVQKQEGSNVQVNNNIVVDNSGKQEEDASQDDSSSQEETSSNENNSSQEGNTSNENNSAPASNSSQENDSSEGDTATQDKTPVQETTPVNGNASEKPESSTDSNSTISEKEFLEKMPEGTTIDDVKDVIHQTVFGAMPKSEDKIHNAFLDLTWNLEGSSLWGSDEEGGYLDLDVYDRYLAMVGLRPFDTEADYKQWGEPNQMHWLDGRKFYLTGFGGVRPKVEFTNVKLEKNGNSQFVVFTLNNSYMPETLNEGTMNLRASFVPGKNGTYVLDTITPDTTPLDNGLFQASYPLKMRRADTFLPRCAYTMTISSDGSFEGTNWWITTATGIAEKCKYSGTFKAVKVPEPGVLQLERTSLSQEGTPGESYTDEYGITTTIKTPDKVDGDSTFYLYAPGTLLSALPDGFAEMEHVRKNSYGNRLTRYVICHSSEALWIVDTDMRIEQTSLLGSWSFCVQGQ